MEALGVPEFGQREDLIPREGRHSKNTDDVRAALAISLRERERWPVFHRLIELRCVAGVMQNMADFRTNQQIASRDFLVSLPVAQQIVRTAGAPAKLSPSPWRLTRPAPGLGEHNDAITVRENRRSAPKLYIASSALAKGPLSGIRVLSFCQTWAGPFATELLALLGADVVQVSPPNRTDSFRRFSGHVPPGVADPNRRQHPQNTQGHYNSVNLNKRNITLDISKEKGKELLWQLIPRFDILAENFRPSVFPSWGITLDRLQEMRPGMIWASISGFGETGPYSSFPGNGQTIEPMSGLCSINGYVGDPGMHTGGIYADPVSGYFLVAAIMAALAHRDLTGEAQRVDLSMMEALNVVCGDALLEHTATGQVPGPQGNKHSRIAPHNYYKARNGEWLALATETGEAWRQLAAHIGDQRLNDDRFTTTSSRKAHEAELDELIGTWALEQDAREAERALGKLGVTAARVRPLYDIYSQPDPDFRATGFITEVDHPETGPTWLPGRPWRFSAAAAAPVRPAPCVGQHSREVLAEELGITASEYLSLVESRVTGTLDEMQSHGNPETRR
jgi:crotonobetainyl-CoA:carnitine CoA-transferase CaiB-like acyl-CoA transferase